MVTYAEMLDEPSRIRELDPVFLAVIEYQRVNFEAAFYRNRRRRGRSIPPLSSTTPFFSSMPLLRAVMGRRSRGMFCRYAFALDNDNTHQPVKR